MRAGGMVGVRALSMLSALVICACSRSPERPNIVVISIDTLRADALGAYGETRPTSPAFDAFARAAIVFTDATSQSGLTAPSHMTLFTSLYPSVHQVSNRTLGKDASFPRSLAPQVRTLAEMFRDAGWHTAAFVSGGNLNRECGFDQGFELFDQDDTNGMNGNREQPFDVSRAAQWMREHADEPYFLFLHTYIPHAPYLPPPPWNTAFDPDSTGAVPRDREAFYAAPAASTAERSARFWAGVDPANPQHVEDLRGLYAGDVRYADDAFASMLAALDQSGALERTIVVVLSDHGEEFLEHGHFEHPHDIYREHVHVPLVFRLPGASPRRIDTPVRLLDVMPTLLELAGVAAPRGIQGRSLVPLWSGAPVPGGESISEAILSWKTPVEGEAWQPLESLRTLRADGWTYLERRKGKQRVEELYDTRTDPGESHDLAAQPAQAERLAAFRALLAAHDDRCRELAREFAGSAPAEMSAETEAELGALGYVDR